MTYYPLCFGTGPGPEELLFLPGCSSDIEHLSFQDLEQGWALSSRMKGGGSIGPTQQGYPMGEWRWCLPSVPQAQQHRPGCCESAEAAETGALASTTAARGQREEEVCGAKQT